VLLQRSEGEADWAGFSIDVARAYAEATRRRMEWVRFRWPGLTTDLAAERFDLALSGITIRPDRSISGRFSHPLTASGAVALVPTEADLWSAADLDVPGRAIAVNAGGHLEQTARRLFPKARIEAIANNAAVLDRLGRDGVHAVLTDSLEAPHWQARHPGPLRAIGPLTRDRKAAWFPPSRTAEAARFDAWLIEAEAAGTLAALRAKHGLPTTATCEPSAALVARIDERLSLMTRVAQSKWVRGVAIEDQTREQRVLERATAAVQAAARRLGRPAPAPEAVTRLYRAQIDAAKAIQRRWITAQGPPVPPAKEADAAAAQTRAREHLEREIRPALLFLGDRIADLVVRVANAPGRPDAAALAAALEGHGLPAEQRDALLDAFSGL
jgi:cyclohexadienyl dehydratase